MDMRRSVARPYRPCNSGYLACGRSAEDHRAVIIEKDAVFGKESDRAGQREPLDVAANLCELLGLLSVTDPMHLLFNDWAFIQIAGDEMGGRPNQFHTAVVGLVIWLGSLEPREEGMVDVDHTTTEFRAEPVGQNLHVSGEHHDVRLALADNGEKFFLLLTLVL